ncbi:MAG: class I SAM-dependent methyltransferase [Candidatus Omnitrophota bacterium]
MGFKFFERFFKFVSPWADFDFKEGRAGAQRLRGFLIRLYHWSQREFAIRYAPVIRELRKRPKEYANILEVGSGSMGLTRYTKRQIVGVDLSTQGPRFENMCLVRADASALPFADRSFDLVVSTDVLEHLPQDVRRRAVKELLRVANKKIFLGFPSGVVALRWEKKVFDRFQKKTIEWRGTAKGLEDYRSRFWYLGEHAQCGLPDEESVRQCLRASTENFDRDYRVSVIDNESVLIWYLAVTRMINGSYLRWLLITLLYIIFYPLISRATWPCSYRKIFIIERIAA